MSSSLGGMSVVRAYSPPQTLYTNTHTREKAEKGTINMQCWEKSPHSPLFVSKCACVNPQKTAFGRGEQSRIACIVNCVTNINLVT